MSSLAMIVWRHYSPIQNYLEATSEGKSVDSRDNGLLSQSSTYSREAGVWMRAEPWLVESCLGIPLACEDLSVLTLERPWWSVWRS